MKHAVRPMHGAPVSDATMSDAPMSNATMCNATAHAASGRRVGIAHRRGFGIRAKLFLAFGGVAGLTVVAAAVAMLSYNTVGAALRGITEDNLPAMTLSLKLAKSSSEVASAAPAVLAAGDVHQRDTAVAALT